MSRSSYLLLVVMLGTLSAMPAVSIDTSLAAIPAMADGLNTSAGMVQLTISAYVFGTALGQLFLAPLSDRYGRRPALFAGLAFYIAAAAGCAFATSVEMLAVLRFIMGASTFTGRILPRAMARDLFEREDTARMISYMMVFGGLAPIFASYIGAVLSETYGWPAVFLFILGYGVVILLIAIPFLKETLPPGRRIAINPAIMLVNFRTVMRNRIFLSYGACVFLTMAALMAFLVSSSSVAILYLGKTPREFGIAMGMVMIGYSLFGFTAGRIVGRFGIDRMIACGTTIGTVAALAMLGLALADVRALWAVMAPMALFMAAFAFVVPQAIAGALTPFGSMAGSAMANLGFIQTCGSAVTATIAGLLFDGTQMPMVALIAFFATASCAAWYFLIRRLKSIPEAL